VCPPLHLPCVYLQENSTQSQISTTALPAARKRSFNPYNCLTCFGEMRSLLLMLIPALLIPFCSRQIFSERIGWHGHQDDYQVV
jgi:hypothetical protein